MFLRKVYPGRRGVKSKQIYWELVESYRTAKGSRQRTVAYLGKLSRKEVSGWQKLSENLNGHPPSPPGLFDVRNPEAAGDAADVHLVDVKSVAVQRLRRFGEVFLAWTLWRVLGLDDLLAREMPAGREQVPWATVAAILCISRFCRPSSELHIEKHFYPQSALEDLLGVEASLVHTDRLYAGMDQLLKQKKAIEQHLRQRLGELFQLSYDLLLYDLTSTYFEGKCAANPKAKRGYSRDSRPDCPQVVIALIVTVDGYPLGYEVFSGNTADSTTVQAIVKKVEEEHGQLNRIWVMDRGNVSEANLAFIRERGGRYIVGTPKAMLRQVQGQITDQGWQQVREGIEVKVVKTTTAGATDANKANGEQATETLVLCRSQDRVVKESAMLGRFVDRLEAGLKKLAASAEKGRLKDLETANRRLGRLLEKNWRAGNCFQVNIAAIAQPSAKAKLLVSWTKDQQLKHALCGCYLLRTNLPQPDPVALWRQYIQLVDAEWAFRISKDELELRPVWHQQDGRVQGHILVCFIAYAMWKTLGGWMAASGLGEAPRPLVEELSTIKSADVMLPTRQSDGSEGTTLVIRCVTRPDEHQEVLLTRLGIELPNQLKRFQTGGESACDNRRNVV
ncbi:MAG: IS1634 family transposase [Steroidobacteraceae bacterium]